MGKDTKAIAVTLNVPEATVWNHMELIKQAAKDSRFRVWKSDPPETESEALAIVVAKREPATASFEGQCIYCDMGHKPFNRYHYWKSGGQYVCTRSPE